MGINSSNFDENLLLAILSKFKLTSLEVWDGDKDEDILFSLLQMSSTQETLEHFRIFFLDISKCTYVVGLLAEFKRIKTIKITWNYSKYNDKLEEWKLKIEQFKEILKIKHSHIEIDIKYWKDKSLKLISLN